MSSSKVDPTKPPACLPSVIMEITHAVEKTEMIYNASQLRLFDKLAQCTEPVGSVQLCRLMDVPETSSDVVGRLLNVLAAMGLLVKSHTDAGPVFRNSEETAIWLTTDSPYSLQKLVDAARHTFDLADLVKKAEQDTSRNWFSDVAENEKAFREVPHRFNRYWSKQDAYSKTSIHLLKAFDLSQFKTVVDLGGGMGSVCRALMNFYPDMDVTNLEMPRVVDFCQKKEAETGATKVKYYAADVFGEEPLPKADLYILGHFLHMFHEDKCNSILNRVRQFINPGGAILILEKVMHDDNEGPELCLLYDVRMGMTGGKGQERTRDQFSTLLRNNGFLQPQFHQGEDYGIYDAVLASKDGQ